MKRAITISGAILLVTLTIGLFWSNVAPATPALAQTDQNATERMIQVNGAGRVSATPDMAILQLGVTTQAETAGEALDQNSVDMSGVISATLEAGVESEDIQTLGIRLQSIYDQSEDGQKED